MFERSIPAKSAEATTTEQTEFAYYLEWQWPDHIETVLRRMLWISLVEAAEDGGRHRQHTRFLRQLIAAWPATSPAVLDFLSGCADDDNLLVRIAENPSADAATLQKLAAHSCAEVKIAVAENPLTPLVTLQLLIENADADVRHAMAENAALPAELLEQLAADENVYVSTRARKTLAKRNRATVSELPLSVRDRRLSNKRKAV